MSEFTITDQVPVRGLSAARTSYRIPQTCELDALLPCSEAELTLGFRFPAHASRHAQGRKVVAEAVQALAVGLTGFLLVAAVVMSAACVFRALLA